jgi:hypothetical protein
LETTLDGAGTALLQQECEDGIAEASHVRAIFLQQLCSAAVMLRPGVMQAARGCPKSTSTIVLATICATLFNDLILSYAAIRITKTALELEIRAAAPLKKL